MGSYSIKYATVYMAWQCCLMMQGALGKVELGVYLAIEGNVSRFDLSVDLSSLVSD